MWNDSDEAILISLVKNQKPIWKQEKNARRNTHSLGHYWEAVSKSINKPKQVIQTKWKTLLRRMRNEIIAVQNTGGKSSWKHYERMSFLIPDTNSEDSQLDDTTYEEIDELDNTSVEVEDMSGTKRGKSNTPERNTNEPQKRKSVENDSQGNVSSTSNNEDINFFTTLLPDLSIISRPTVLNIRQDITKLILQHAYPLKQAKEEDCILVDVVIPKKKKNKIRKSEPEKKFIKLESHSCEPEKKFIKLESHSCEPVKKLEVTAAVNTNSDLTRGATAPLNPALYHPAYNYYNQPSVYSQIQHPAWNCQQLPNNFLGQWYGMPNNAMVNPDFAKLVIPAMPINSIQLQEVIRAPSVLTLPNVSNGPILATTAEVNLGMQNSNTNLVPGNFRATPMHGNSSATPMHDNSTANLMPGNPRETPMPSNSRATPMPGDPRATPMHSNSSEIPMRSNYMANPMPGNPRATPMHGNFTANLIPGNPRAILMPPGYTRAAEMPGYFTATSMPSCFMASSMPGYSTATMSNLIANNRQGTPMIYTAAMPSVNRNLNFSQVFTEPPNVTARSVATPNTTSTTQFATLNTANQMNQNEMPSMRLNGRESVSSFVPDPSNQMHSSNAAFAPKQNSTEDDANVTNHSST